MHVAACGDVLKLRLAQADAKLACKERDGGGRCALGPHDCFEPPRGFEIDRTRKAVRDDG
jgi:hypothetical protein